MPLILLRIINFNLRIEWKSCSIYPKFHHSLNLHSKFLAAVKVVSIWKNRRKFIKTSPVRLANSIIQRYQTNFWLGFLILTTSVAAPRPSSQVILGYSDTEFYQTHYNHLRSIHEREGILPPPPPENFRDLLVGYYAIINLVGYYDQDSTIPLQSWLNSWERVDGLHSDPTCGCYERCCSCCSGKYQDCIG